LGGIPDLKPIEIDRGHAWPDKSPPASACDNLPRAFLWARHFPERSCQWKNQ
jgi:hypothetical protein